MQSIAIIPARGGSKVIPGKNIRIFAGKPLIVWTIEAALAARSVQHVVVSTDDDAIAAVAAAAGAEVVRRPASISGDTAGSEVALLHVLGALEGAGALPEAIAFLQCTSPTVTPKIIDGAVGRLAEGCDSVFTAVPSHAFLWQDSGSGVVGVNHEAAHRLRRQDRPAEWIEVGMCYAMRTAGFLKHRHRFFGRIGIYEIGAEHAIELDNERDWRFAEYLKSAVCDHKPPFPDFGPVRLVVTDFDGVLTDDAVWVDQNGCESVRCYRGDGYGSGLLKKAGIEVCVLSTERNPVVSARCKKLDVLCVQNCTDKLTAIRRLADERGLTAAQVAFIGNDLNDLEALQWVGIPVAVADAHPEILKASTLRTTKKGGFGAFREVVEWMVGGN